MVGQTQNNGKLMAVIGGQYGSEGKGTVVRKIANEYDYHVRVGSHNAGHSFKDDHGKVWKMQQVPVGWINPEATLVIGPGALISPETLTREINEIAVVDPTIHRRLMIDPKAGVLDIHHHVSEGGTEGEIHNRIGSTGEGVGAARIARLRREPYKAEVWRDIPNIEQTITTGFRNFGQLIHDPKWNHLGRYVWPNTSKLLKQELEEGAAVLLEGSQGVGLSITHGPWPYVTTTDCGAAQLCADVGLPPQWLTDVLCVVRTFPIRVAGNSGPMNNEITWEQLSAELGRDVSERTTVTKKIRRIGRWDEEQIDLAVTLNAPTAFALNFVDYLNTADEGVDAYDQLSVDSRTFIAFLEQNYRTHVDFVGTGGEKWTVIDRRNSNGV